MSSHLVNGSVETDEIRDSISPPLYVCHITSGAIWAGIEAQVTTLLRVMSGCSNVKLLVILLNEGRLGDELRRSGIEVHIVPERKGVLGIVLGIMRLLKSRNIQVVHSHRSKEHFVALLASVFCRIPVLVRTQHGKREQASGWRGVRHRINLSLESYLARFGPAHTISVSSELAEYLGTRIGPQKLTVIPNGIEVERTTSTKSRAEAKAWLRIDPQSPVICSVARLNIVKRHDLFLQTAAHVLRDYPNAHFVIAGSGPMQAEINKAIGALGISAKVHMLGDCADIYDVFAASDILLITSDHEGLPMAVLEAMALGTVVVARRVGGLPELLGNGTNGVLVDSADPGALARACSEVLYDDDRRNDIVRSARRVVSHQYSAQRSVCQTVDLYLRLLQRRRPSV